MPGQEAFPLLVFISDVHSMGLQTAQGLKFATAFYWDRDEESRYDSYALTTSLARSVVAEGRDTCRGACSRRQGARR